MTDWTLLLQQLLAQESLSQSQASTLMEGWLKEEISPALSGAILAALQAKGVSGAELAGMAQVLQSQSLQSDLISHSVPVIDTCGTGGDGSSTFNISTAVAFVAAAAGVKVAKHGNRSASSKVGSADVLEHLGVKLNGDIEEYKQALDEVGVTFLFAPGWHPAMKAVGPIRRELKIRTIFNLLGPLVNPLRPTGQIIGVYALEFIDPMAQALHSLGVKRAIALHGREKLDEAGLGDITDMTVIDNATVNKNHHQSPRIRFNPCHPRRFKRRRCPRKRPHFNSSITRKRHPSPNRCCSFKRFPSPTSRRNYPSRGLHHSH